MEEININQHLIVNFRDGKTNIYLDGKDIMNLTKYEKETIYCENNKDIKNLLTSLLKERGVSFKKGFSFLKFLIRLGDESAKDVVKELIRQAFDTDNITSLEFYYKALFFYYLTKEEKEVYFYNNNEKLRDFINEALRHEDYSIKFGFPLLLVLFRIGDKEAKNELKKGLRRWIFKGKHTTTDLIIKKYIQPYQQFKIFKYKDHNIEQRFKFFNYKELLDLHEDPRCPEQLKMYIDEYIEKFNKIYSRMGELIVSKEILMTKFNIQPKEDSEFFLMLTNSRKHKKKPIFIPIYNNSVKKITINNSESSFEPIRERIGDLKSKFDVLFEGIDTFRVESGLIKNVFELYFYDTNILTNEAIKDKFSSISDDLMIEIFKV